MPILSDSAENTNSKLHIGVVGLFPGEFTTAVGWARFFAHAWVVFFRVGTKNVPTLRLGH